MTETQVPQPIEWDQVRVGDVIRAEKGYPGGTRVITEGTVSGFGEIGPYFKFGAVADWDASVAQKEQQSLTLISRPAPEVKCKNCVQPIRIADEGIWRHEDGGRSRCTLYAEPAQPDPILCKWCDRAIEKYPSTCWQHVGSQSLSCGTYFSKLATPKATS